MSFESAPSINTFNVEVSRRVKVETLEKLSGQVEKFGRRLSSVFKIDTTIEDEKAINKGLTIGTRINKQFARTPEGATVKNFLTATTKGVSNLLLEKGIDPSKLVTQPAETIGKMIGIDSRVARKMLEMLGIQTQVLSPQPTGSSFTRNALAAEYIGAIVYANASRPDNRKAYNPKPTGHVEDVAKLPTQPKRIIKRGDVDIPIGVEGNLGKKKFTIKGHEFEVPWPKNLGVKTKNIQYEGLTVSKPQIKPRLPIGRKGCTLLGVSALLGICLAYNFIEPVGKLIDRIAVNPTPTPIPLAPTALPFEARIKNIALENYKNGSAPIDFMNVHAADTINVTAYGVDQNTPPNVWMWTKNTPNSLDEYRTILGKPVTQEEINAFKANPNRFISWLRENEFYNQAEFYSYRLYGDKGIPPTGEEFAKWAKSRPFPTPTPR